MFIEQSTRLVRAVAVEQPTTKRKKETNKQTNDVRDVDDVGFCSAAGRADQLFGAEPDVRRGGGLVPAQFRRRPRPTVPARDVRHRVRTLTVSRYRVFFVPLYWVLNLGLLLAFPKPIETVLLPTGSYWVSSRLLAEITRDTWLYRFLSSFTGFYWVLPASCWHFSRWIDCSWLHCSGLH